MANFTNLSGITYCGKEGNEIFSKSLYTIDLATYGITYMPNVKGKQKLYSGEIGDAWQQYTCDFTPQGLASLSEAYIEPVAIKVNMENCFDQFWPTYLVEQTQINLHGGIPQTFAEWFFAKLVEKMKREYQEIFWQGDTSYSGATKVYKKVTDGIEKKLESASGSSAANKISGSAFTVANIVEQVESVITSGMSVAANSEIDTDGWKVFMNYADVDVLKMALGKSCCPNNQSIFSNYANVNGRVYIFGVEIVPTMQSRNTCIYGPARNLVLGFDTESAETEYEIINMKQTTGDNKFRVIAITNIAVGIVAPELFTYLR